MNNVQVNKNHYEFDKYVESARWSSYYEQIMWATKVRENGNILLVGKGDGLVAKIIKIIRQDINIVICDFDKELEPDICCDILELSKVESNKYDVVICCQVLEHLPFEKFYDALTNIYDVLSAGGRVILSLPDRSGYRWISINLGWIHWNISGKRNKRKCRKDKEFIFDGEHYWEINAAKKYHERIIRSIISKQFTINKEYCVKNNKYHHFYILSK